MTTLTHRMTPKWFVGGKFLWEPNGKQGVYDFGENLKSMRFFLLPKDYCSSPLRSFFIVREAKKTAEPSI